MRKLVVSTFLTLDGVMQAPGGPGEDDSGGFAHGGWSVNYWDEQMEQVMGQAMSTPFDLVLGRKTYDIFAAYWPHATDAAGAKPLNDATKYVASRSHPALEWSNSVPIEGDAAEGIARSGRKMGQSCRCMAAGTWARRCCATTLSTSTGCGSSPSSSGRANACSRKAPSRPG